MVWVVLVRNGYQGPWKTASIHTTKPEANRARERLIYSWSESKVVREFSYLAKVNI